MSKKLYDVAEFNRQWFLGAIDKAVLNDTLGVFAGSSADWKSLAAHADCFWNCRCVPAVSGPVIA
jgi:hypothetical protein